MTENVSNFAAKRERRLEELNSFAAQSCILKEWEPVSFMDKGTFSRIFKVVNRQTGQEAALKFVPNPIEEDDCDQPDSPEDTFYRSRFEASKREAEIMNRFRGEDNIVQYLVDPEYLQRTFEGEHGEMLMQYAVMICMPLYINHKEWMPAIAQDYERRIQMGIDISHALMTFEENGVYHRDIKPGNIMMDGNGTFYLADVGEAKLESEFTTIGFHGTRPYMAPEVYRQENERRKMRSDHRSDIYSLGIVLYRLFNHQQFPFLTDEGSLTVDASRSYSQYEKKNGMEGSLLPDSERARLLRYDGQKLPRPAEADDQLAEVILRACAYKQDDRCQTAEELYHALRACLEQGNASLCKQRRADPKTRGCMKRLLGLSAALLVVLVSVIFFAMRDPQPTPAAPTQPPLTATAAPTATATAAPTATATAAPTATATTAPTATATTAPTATATTAPTTTATVAAAERRPSVPAVSAKSAPAACTLEQSPKGIAIRIPELNHSDIQEIKIYRTAQNGGRTSVTTLDYPSEKTYVDDLLVLDEQYTYYYTVKCACEEPFPDSQTATIRWTKYSQISNLKVRQDPDDIRTLHISWDDIPGGEYFVCIYQLNDEGEIGLCEWDEGNGLYTTTQMSFYNALPRTKYLIKVYDLVTYNCVEKTFSVGAAPDYSKYGARCDGGTMYWFKRSDLDKGKKPWDDGVKLKKYSTISVNEFAHMLEDYAFFSESQFVYRKTSSDHYFDALCILRDPYGNVVYEEYFDKLLEDCNKNWQWRYYFPWVPSLKKYPAVTV